MLSILISFVMFVVTLPMNTVMLAIKLKASAGGKDENGGKEGSLRERLRLGKKKSSTPTDKKNKKSEKMMKALKKLQLALKALILFLRACATALSIIGTIISLLLTFGLVFLVVGAVAAILLVVTMKGYQFTGFSSGGYFGSESSSEVVIAGDNSTWASSCKTMWEWYCANVNTYQHCINFRSSSQNDGFLSCKGNPECSGGVGAVGPRHAYTCSLLSDTDYTVVMDDCSAYVGACLSYGGFWNGDPTHLGSSHFKPGGMITSHSEFTSHFTMYTPADYGVTYFPKIGDIYVQEGHVEIYAGTEGGKGMSWSWGSVPECVINKTGNGAVVRSEFPNYVNYLWYGDRAVICIWQHNGS